MDLVLKSMLRIALPLTLICLSACKTRSDTPDETTLFADVQSEAVSAQLDNFENRPAWIDHYAGYPAICVSRVDQFDAGRAVFNGCYDWHSSVHGHWAVLRADLTGARAAPQAAVNIDRRLTPEALAAVRADLTAAAYEMPYGRAWFLRLASEHERWATARNVPDPQRLRDLGRFVAATMDAYYDANQPTPRSSDYRNDSWAIAQMAAWYRHLGDEQGIAKTAARVERHFVASPMTWAESNDSDPSAFFSRYWGWVYTVAESLDSARAIEVIRPESIPDAALTPIPDPNQRNDVHHIGINWSRAWGIKSLAAQVIAVRGADDPQAVRLIRAYHLHVQAGRQRHERYRGDYYAYDHWVPQFAIYAITD